MSVWVEESFVLTVLVCVVVVWSLINVCVEFDVKSISIVCVSESIIVIGEV